VAYTAAAGSLTVNQNASSVMVWCSTAAFVRVGTTATVTDMPVPANAPVIIPIPSSAQTGSAITVSAIQDTTGGTLYAIGLAE
jgi:phage baseplate assembly protein gpV